MTVEITVGPPQLAIHQGFTVLLTAPDGSITGPGEHGLYFRDTRLVSAYAASANGEPFDLLNSGAPAYYGCRIYLANRPFISEAGPVPARTLSLVLGRVIDGGLLERHEITNHGRAPVAFNYEIVLRCDFADVFEVKSARIVRRGRIASAWDETAQALTTTYSNGPFRRGLRIRSPGALPPAWVNGRITFEVRLDPGATWTGHLAFDLMDGDETLPAPTECDLGPQSRQGRELLAWRAGALTLQSSNDRFEQLFAQAVEDIASLRLQIPCNSHLATIPAAGLPWFVALFGRDTIITSLQAITLGPEFARGTLDVLAAWQATTRDDYRDAEPGKILHELRQGELAALKLIPHTPYYGTADATPLYLVLLHAAWKSTGDLDLVRRHLATAEACLRWIDECGDRDADGFQEYGTRSGQGYENVGWKDSGDAVVDTTGQPVQGPKALCELQGYVYAARRGMAELHRALGNPTRADALDAQAATLFDRFNQVFWNEAEGFYAYCLDGAKTPIFSIASNPGHLLWSGIVPKSRAARVAARLMQPDMWSGWGVRTLGAGNPAYNPYSYQNGSVWPHDNSLIALGCKRYGLDDAANRIAADVQHAAAFFTHRQLPELYSGVERDAANFPVQYLGANVPQAWAAASVFALTQAMLGLEPDAPNDRLLVRPTLPDWLPDVTLRNLRVGRHGFTIAFRRRLDGQTEFQVLEGDPAAVLHADAAGAALA